MSRLKWLTAFAAAGSLSAGVAVGASTSPETTPVTADFRAQIASESQRQCDPAHVLFRVTFEGTQTSGDPRLAGDLTARVRSVVNITTGWGHTAGKVIVRDASTGDVKLRARLFGVIAPDGSVEGVYVGGTTGPDSARLVANWNANQDPTTGAVSGEVGKDSQTGAFQDPAVLSSACGDHDDDGDDDNGDDD